MASGDSINYTVRPAKFAERKIIRDMLISLNRFASLADYKYIGFGSKYFADFSLFHRTLHINDMVSIESDIKNKEKYHFNKPFDCIDVVMGKSNEALPKIDFSKEFITWLDYDYSIDESMLNDMGVLIENLVSGSVILTSYNSISWKIAPLRSQFNDQESSYKELFIKKLIGLVTEKYIPANIPDKALSKASTFSRIVRSIFVLKIEELLNEKNAALDWQDKWKYKQIMYFQYKDGADMATLGWVFYQEKDRSRIESCCFDKDEFSRDDENFYEIKIPNLTVKEINSLQNAMPFNGSIDRVKLPESIYSDEDILCFSKIYKYFPSFMNVDFF